MRNSWRKKGEFNSWKWGFKQQIEIQPTTGDKLKSSAVMVQPCTQVSYPQVLVQLSVMFAPPFWSVQFHFCLGLSPKLCWWKDTLFLGTSEIRWYHPPIHSDIFWHKQGSFFKNQLVRGQRYSIINRNLEWYPPVNSECGFFIDQTSRPFPGKTKNTDFRISQESCC